MKTFLLCSFVAILFSAGMIACTKENSGPADPSLPLDTTCKVASISYKYAPYLDLETRMQYDAAGRIIKATDYDSSRPRWSATFEYSAGKITEIDSAASAGSNVIDLQSVVIYHEIGSNGFATVSYFHGYETVRDTTYYTYDTDGYLTKSVRKHYSVYPLNTPQRLEYVETHDYTISGGNRVKEALNGRTAIDYEYYTDLSKFGGFNFTNYYDYPFLGRKNTSLVKTLYSTNPNDASVDRDDYSYKLDAEGKPLVVRHTNQYGSDSLVLSYKCK